MKLLKIDELEKIAKEFNIDDNDTYLFTYPYFIEYFKQIEVFNELNIIIASSSIYSWMPTVLNLNKKYLNKVIKILNNNNRIISKTDLEILKLFINNSLVGASKFLHFYNPNIYPIWDSKICEYFFDKSHQYIISKIDNYLEYFNYCNVFIKENSFNNILDILNTKLNYNISKIRALEMLIFYIMK